MVQLPFKIVFDLGRFLKYCQLINFQLMLLSGRAVFLIILPLTTAEEQNVKFIFDNCLFGTIIAQKNSAFYFNFLS